MASSATLALNSAVKRLRVFISDGPSRRWTHFSSLPQRPAPALYHVGQTRDAETDIAAAMCDRFVHRSLDLEGWRREILHDAPHVLIYPGLLMDEVSHRLAAQRLAAVQCNSWGHPETSGMPT